jgi:hypothetical protein
MVTEVTAQTQKTEQSLPQKSENLYQRHMFTAGNKMCLTLTCYA